MSTPMERKPRVGCAGILVEDTFCGPLADFPHEGSLVCVESMPTHAGGCAANVAIDLVRQGIPVEIAGCVGGDAAAKSLEECFATYGIGRRKLVISQALPTSRTVILLINGQDRRYVHLLGANAAFSAADLDHAWLASLDVLYIGGFFALPAMKCDELAGVFAYCRAEKVKTVLDVAIPHFYLQTSANVEPMMARRNAALPNKLAWDAFFVKAIHNAVTRFDLMACRWEDDQLIPQGTDTIGVAADIHGDLFVVPVESPAEKNIEDISRDIHARVTALRGGDALARIMKPGVMTITNLGVCNVETFTAIINPPESAILAVGKIRPVVIAVSESAFAVQHRVNLTLSIDHRVASGKYAADFLGAIVEEIENL